MAKKITPTDCTKKTCCSSPEQIAFPSHVKEIKRLNRVKGQLDGVERMIDENRYCVDIIYQLRAAASALKALEKEILHTHLKSCVKKAMESNNPQDTKEKIQEIMDLL